MKKYDARAGIPTLELALAEYLDLDEIKRLAALTGVRVPARKADVAAVIQRHLDGDRLRAVWLGMDSLQRAAVAEVVHSRSTAFPTARFRAKYGQDPNWGTRDQLRRLTPSALGFFFFAGMMPADLQARLKAFVPVPDPASVRTLAELPATHGLPVSVWNPTTRRHEARENHVPLVVHASEGRAQRELLAILRLVDTGKVAVSEKTHRPSAASVEAIGALLEGGDYYPHVPVTARSRDENGGPIRAFAWPLLVQAGGLAKLAGSKLQLTPAGRRALSAPPAATLRTLWGRWLDSELLDELSRIECVKGQTGKGQSGLTDVGLRRMAIDNALHACPAGRWLSADELCRVLVATGENYGVTDAPWSLYVCDPNYGRLNCENGPQILDQRYALAVLLEYAATLGLIDVALVPPADARPDHGGLWGADGLAFFSRYDGLTYLRVTRLGAYCLGVEPDYFPPPVEVKAALRVLPTLEITPVGADVLESDRLALDACAVRLPGLAWRLDMARLVAAMEEGRSPDELRRFLEARSDGPLPDPVLALLGDVAARRGQLRDRGLARLVECGDETLAALVASDPRTGRYCFRIAGGREPMLVVPRASEAAFRRALRGVGYAVAEAGAEAEDDADAKPPETPKTPKPGRPRRTR